MVLVEGTLLKQRGRLSQGNTSPTGAPGLSPPPRAALIVLTLFDGFSQQVACLLALLPLIVTVRKNSSQPF